MCLLQFMRLWPVINKPIFCCGQFTRAKFRLNVLLMNDKDNETGNAALVVLAISGSHHLDNLAFWKLLCPIHPSSPFSFQPWLGSSWPFFLYCLRLLSQKRPLQKELEVQNSISQKRILKSVENLHTHWQQKIYFFGKVFLPLLVWFNMHVTLTPCCVGEFHSFDHILFFRINNLGAPPEQLT